MKQNKWFLIVFIIAQAVAFDDGAALSKITAISTQFQKGMTIDQMLNSIGQLALISQPDYSIAVQTQATQLLSKILNDILDSVKRDVAEISVNELKMLVRKIDKILQTPDLVTKNNAVFKELTQALTFFNDLISQQTTPKPAITLPGKPQITPQQSRPVAMSELAAQLEQLQQRVKALQAAMP